MNIMWIIDCVLGKICQLLHFVFVYFDNICFIIIRAFRKP